MFNNTNELTAKEIFTQITILQKQLTDENAMPLYHLSNAVEAIAGTEEDVDATAGKEQQITEVCSVFKARETTLLKLLEMYEKMYADIQKAKKVELIKTAFDNNMAFIESNEMDSGDTAAALTYVTDKIAELLKKVITE